MVFVEYGRAKNQQCIAERGFGFRFAARIWLGDVVEADVTRIEGGEPRFKSIGLIDGVAFAVIWTPREGRRRIVSARKASRTERKTL